MARLPEDFRWLFWDVEFDVLDPGAHSNYILARILEHGRLVEVRWAVVTFGLDRIHRFFREVGHPEITGKTEHFWRAALRAEGEEWARPAAWRRSRSEHWAS